MNLNKSLIFNFKNHLIESKLCHNNKTLKNIKSLEPATIYEVSKFGEKRLNTGN